MVDTTGRAAELLLEAVNSEPGPRYELLLSPRLGRSQHREQVAWLYRPGRVHPAQSRLYPDPADTFARPPFATEWQLERVAGLQRLVTLACHVQPSQVSIIRIF